MWWLLELALIALIAAPLVWAWRQAVANARAAREADAAVEATAATAAAGATEAAEPKTATAADETAARPR